MKAEKLATLALSAGTSLQRARRALMRLDLALDGQLERAGLFAQVDRIAEEVDRVAALALDELAPRERVDYNRD